MHLCMKEPKEEEIGNLEAQEIYQAIQSSEEKIIGHINDLFRIKDKHIAEIQAHTERDLMEVRTTVYGTKSGEGLQADVEKGKNSVKIFKFFASTGILLWLIEMLKRTFGGE